MTFNWPWQYEFPPFFTLQQVLLTREKQLEAWCDLVLDYCQFHKIYTLVVSDISNTELFCNTTLNRRLSSEGVRAVFDFLEQKKHIDWLDNSKNRCHIYWRRPEEWANLLYKWAVSNAQLDIPLTLHELTRGVDTTRESFYGLDKDILIKSLSVLVDEGHAQFLESGSEVEGGRRGRLFFGKSMESKSERITALRTPNAEQGGMALSHRSFLSYTDLIDEGDTVIIYVNFGTVYAIKVKRGCTLHMKYGALRHEFLIGKRFGSRILATAGYVYALRPSADLWTRSLNRRTQILYTPDCSLILMLLDAKPGSIICESGTGSGSLSHALAMVIAPSGHLYTHDIEESRVKDIENEFRDHGLQHLTTCVLKNVCLDGFVVQDLCDGVFLDLPAPWDAIDHAKSALSKSRGGRIVSFSPCIEQVQKVCAVLRSRGFVKVETVELIPRKLKVLGLAKETLEELNTPLLSNETLKTFGDEGSDALLPLGKKRKLADGVNERNIPSFDGLIPFPPSQPSHTGYLTSATLLPVASI